MAVTACKVSVIGAPVSARAAYKFADEVMRQGNNKAVTLDGYTIERKDKNNIVIRESSGSTEYMRLTNGFWSYKAQVYSSEKRAMVDYSFDSRGKVWGELTTTECPSTQFFKGSVADIAFRLFEAKIDAESCTCESGSDGRSF